MQLDVSPVFAQIEACKVSTQSYFKGKYNGGIIGEFGRHRDPYSGLAPCRVFTLFLDPNQLIVLDYDVLYDVLYDVKDQDAHDSFILLGDLSSNPIKHTYKIE